MRSEKYSKLESEKKRVWPKRVLIALVLVAMLVGGGYAAIHQYLVSKFNKVKHTTVDREELSCVDVKGYVNIALLGVDSRKMSKKNLSSNNTDCIMIVSLNTKNNEVSLISVYRDTYLPVNDNGDFGKINSAFANGGAAQTMQSLNQAMDLNLENYVLFNFKMVSDLVNEVGGITVNVKQYEIQQLNKYTIRTARNIGQKKYKLVTKPGKQKLEGVQAVSYGRIRKGVGDDYKRTNRMRVVVSKVLKELKDANMSELNDIMDTCLKQCETSLSNKDMMSLAMCLPKVKIKNSKGWPFEVGDGYVGEQSVVYPIDLEQNVIELHEKMFKQKDYEVTSTVKEIASKLKAKITSRGVSSAYGGSSSSRSTSSSSGYRGSTGGYSGSSSGTSGAGRTSGSSGGTASGTDSGAGTGGGTGADTSGGATAPVDNGAASGSATGGGESAE